MSKYKIKAAIFTYIPIAITIITIICFVLAILLEQPTNRGPLYTIVALIAILNLCLMPFPCLASSIVGCVFSTMGLNNGENTKPFFIISIIEIVFTSIMILLSIYMIFVVGPSV